MMSVPFDGKMVLHCVVKKVLNVSCNMLAQYSTYGNPLRPLEVYNQGYFNDKNDSLR